MIQSDEWRVRAEMAEKRCDEHEARIALLKGCCADMEYWQDQAKALREHVELLQQKIDPETSCACAYDAPDDVCAVHSPHVARLREERDAHKADAQRLLASQAEAVAERDGLREMLAGIHNDINVAGSPYDKALTAVAEIVSDVRARLRVALKEPRNDNHG